MTRSDSLWILAILPLLADSTSELWFLQPPSRNQVLNGTETRIHCQLHNKAEQVQWWFRPEGEHWKTVKLYPNPSYVTKYDHFDRYLINERVNIVDNAAVYEYDLAIEPVTWADRGEWKCGLPILGEQSSIGKLEVNIPLKSMSISAGGRPNVSNQGHEETIVVDEEDDLTIWCRTGFAYPAPDSIEIYIDDKKQNRVEIQTQTSADGLSMMTGSLMIRQASRSKLHGSQVLCIGNWQNQQSRALSRVSVFFPTTAVSVQTEEVAWNQLLQAHCNLETDSNPAPHISWYLDGKILDKTGPTLEMGVNRSQDRSQLRCVATHTKFRTAEKIQTSSKSSRIRVQYPPSGEPKLTQKMTRGNELVFECTTSTAYPASEISIDFESAGEFILDAPVPVPDGGGYRVTQKLTIPADPKYFNKSVVCTESWPVKENPIFKLQTQDWAMVPHPPSKVQLLVNGQKVERDQVTVPTGLNDFGCLVYGGYPEPSRADFLLTVENNPLSIKKTSTGFSGLYEITKSHNEKVVRCSLKTNSGKLTTEAVMNVTFVSETLSMSFERNQYNIGDKVRVSIETGASYPSANISCLKRHYDEQTDLKVSSSSLKPALPYGTTTSASLEFTTTRFDHGAQIVCRTDGGTKSELVLNVLTAPFFMPNQVFEVAEDSELIIPIDRIIRANPPVATVEWRKIKPKSGALEIDQNRLILSNVKQSDMGEYFVKSAEIQGKITIVVLSPPKLYISGATQIVTGSPLDLTCFAEGRPAPRVYWSRGPDREFIINGTKLSIPAMTSQSADVYTCHGINSQKASETSTQVVVQHAPNVTATNDRVIVYPDGRRLTLACKVDAIPDVVDVDFIPPTKAKKLRQSYKAIREQDEWVLRFERPTSQHYGIWTCQAKNRLASDSAQIFVMPAGPPETTSNLSTEMLNTHSAKVIWKRGEDNGYSQKFRVSVTSTEVAADGKPKHSKDYLTYNNNLVIRNLTESMSYRLKIVAENDLGKSEPLEFTYHFAREDPTTAGTSYLLISLVAISVLILLILLTALFIHKKREMIYQTKKMDPGDVRSLSESENLMKDSSDSNAHTSREDSLTKQRVLQDPLHYYTLQMNKTLPSPPMSVQLAKPEHLDYSPAEVMQASDQYGTTLCHRHRQYDTMPKLIDTTSGYCSSSNSSYSNSSNVPRSRSFQPPRKPRKSGEGVLV